MDEAEFPEEDRKLLASTDDSDRRDVMACSIAAHRSEERLVEGDPVPSLSVPRLEDAAPVELAEARERPLVLVFGSYT